MATILDNKKKLAFNRLLMTIGHELNEKDFKKLINLYDVKPSEPIDPYDVLKELVCMTKDDLDELVKNLATIKHGDVSNKVTQFIEEHFEAKPETLVEPVPETRPPNEEDLKEPILETRSNEGQSNMKPIQEEETDGASQTVQG